MKPYYSFSKKESVLLLISFVILVLLTLAAGWIIGIMARSHSDQTSTEIRGQAAPLPSGMRNIPGVAEKGQVAASVTSAERNIAAMAPVSKAGERGSSPSSQDSETDRNAPAPSVEVKAENFPAAGNAPSPAAEVEKKNFPAQGNVPVVPSAETEAKDSPLQGSDFPPGSEVKAAEESLNEDRKTRDGKKQPESVPQTDSVQIGDKTAGISADTYKADAPDVRFCLIADTFVVKSKALKRLNELREKGYSKTAILCFPPSDRDSNMMNYLIQVGSYESLSTANLVASEFWEKEKSLAVIRPISLSDLKEKLMKPEEGK